MKDQIKNHRTSDIGHRTLRKQGFSLIELIVALAITAVIMVGMSTFFASTFSNIFTAQERVSNEQEQFTTNEVLRDKLLQVDALVENPGDYIVTRNDTSEGHLPFTYFGEDSDHIVFKDFFVFNDVEIDVDSPTSYAYGNSGGGQIIEGGSTTNVPPNFAGFTKNTELTVEYYYITYPLENKVIKCEKIPNPTCSDIITDLNTPIGVESYENTGADDRLAISDSGNDRIIITDLVGTELLAVENVDFPAGITHGGVDSGSDVIFVANPYENTVQKIILDGTPAPEVVVGSGDDEICSNSALYCKLDFPTGVFVDKVNNTLYIAETGGDRILKVTDPQSLLAEYSIPFTLDSDTKVSKIDFIFEAGSSIVFSENSNDLHSANYDGSNPEVITYSLSAPVSISTATYCYDHDSDPMTANLCYFLERFILDADTNIFANSDEAQIDVDTYTVNYINVNDVYINENTVKQNGDDTTDLYPGESLYLRKEFIADDYEFEFDLTGSTFPNIFNDFEIKIYDETDTEVQSITKSFRYGDGIIGTYEDIIEVILEDPDVNFPTGIGAIVNMANNLVLYGNTGSEEKIQYDLDTSTPSANGISIFSKDDITSYDYKSDFYLNSNIIFTDDGSVLDMQIEAIVTEVDGVPVTETYTLTTSLN
ncbi:prepilin-type N-terminal cleavage/methylation domain-containing protein [Patescibacteria group bacterium]|nr:prepilin-type N-terminal cleavage/methylation domain-containing protein [Patescibacteria group bacterium]